MLVGTDNYKRMPCSTRVSESASDKGTEKTSADTKFKVEPLKEDPEDHVFYPS
jgi:hypothetical protein